MGEHGNQSQKTPDVGQSISRRGEEMTEREGKEAGRYDTDPKGKTQRPTGKSTPRDQTGINPARRD